MYTLERYNAKLFKNRYIERDLYKEDNNQFAWLRGHKELRLCVCEGVGGG